MVEFVSFADRTAAGRALAAQLKHYADQKDVVVLGIPRGGVPVAFEVSAALHAPLDVFVVRKLGVPGQEELGLGAIASGGVRILDPEIIESVGISGTEIDGIVARETRELERRERLYRADRPPLNVRGRTVILVDDGIATGSSTRAAIAALRQLGPAKIVVAVPVAPASTCRRLREAVDELVCVHSPEPFIAIGRFYDDFSQVTDEEVADLLHRAPKPRAQDAGQGRDLSSAEGGRG